MIWSAQALLYENQIVQSGKNREDESCPQKYCASDPDPTDFVDLEQQHKKYGADLRKSVRLAEDAGTEIS